MSPDPMVLGQIDRLTGEGLIGMAAAARKLGSYRGGRPVHPSTLTRWAKRPVATPDGGTAVLEVVRMSGRLATSWPAVLRYLAAQQPTTTATTPPVRTRSERRRAADRAAEALERAGA